MSKCAHALAAETKRAKNSAAVTDPAKPPLGALSRSATLLSSIAS